MKKKQCIFGAAITAPILFSTFILGYYREALDKLSTRLILEFTFIYFSFVFGALAVIYIYIAVKSIVKLKLPSDTWMLRFFDIKEPVVGYYGLYQSTVILISSSIIFYCVVNIFLTYGDLIDYVLNQRS